MATMREALSKVFPYKHFLDGNCNLAEYLSHLSIWMRRYRATKVVVDPAKVGKSLADPGGDEMQWHPCIALSDAIGAFLNSECDQSVVPDIVLRLGYNPKFLIPAEGEAEVSQRSSPVCIVPLSGSKETKAMRTSIPFEGMGDATQAKDISVGGARFS